jgi:ParB-like chromosome segregation protein Spo0J
VSDRPRPRAQLVRVQDLQVAEWNPRTMYRERFDNLRRSIREDPEFLWHRPILALRDGTVYAGNQRLRAAIAEGFREVPAIVEDVGLEQAKRRALRDNSTWGAWEEQDLAELLAGLEGDKTAVGFTEDELQRLLETIGETEPAEQTDRARAGLARALRRVRDDDGNLVLLPGHAGGAIVAWSEDGRIVSVQSITAAAATADQAKERTSASATD